ncbi:MAG: IS4 family transposase, partial [Candidatus Staskawiczbacteria bacterium]|nr:IS4 family transposase [Candidatus Staskawiczbacteria bacterium]
MKLLAAYIQDTSYFTYSNHKKTTGLGIICTKVGTNVNKETKGLIMHTTLAVSTKGLPLGMLDQKIYARPEIPEEQKALKKKSHGNALCIEDKESIRWLESLKNANKAAEETTVVTVCDREADIYDFFALAHKLNKPVLIRAAQDRNVNKASIYSKKNKQKLWDVIENMPCAGSIIVEVPAKNNQSSRIANLEIKFGEFMMNPPRNNIKNRTEILPNIPLRAIYVIEKRPPSEATPLEWLLITNLTIDNFDEAIEKIRWYCFRWRIEVFYKILK